MRVTKKEQEKLTLEIRNEINFWQTTFENTLMPAMRELAIVHLEKAKAQLDKLLDERGNSGRSKAKWYQEGEKSSKYFFNLEKSKMNKTEIKMEF